MSITLEQAKALRPGDILIDTRGKRWKVNGQVKRWKREPDRIHVPLKHGLYAYDSLEYPSGEWTDKVCGAVTLESEMPS